MDPLERLKEETEETIHYLRNNGLEKIDIGIVLGFGLQEASQFLTMVRSLEIEDIPNFPVILSYGYGKRLLFSEVMGKKVVVLEGHFNLFEGYTARSVAYPVWVFSRLGTKTLLYLAEGFTLEEKEEAGGLFLAEDHLNFIDENPIFGVIERNSSVGFRDKGGVYDPGLIKILSRLLEEKKARWKKGIIAFKRGPMVETRAEARFLKNAGADLVCYSGYPEVVTAAVLGLNLAFMAVVTGKATQIAGKKERLKTVKSQVPLVKNILKKFIRKVEESGV